MTYYLLHPVEAPDVQVGVELVGYKDKVPELARRVEISNIFRTGRGMLNPAEMPDSFRYDDRLERLPDFFSGYGSIKICSERMHALLEELDPGLHQYIPRTIATKVNGGKSSQVYIVNIHHMLDTIVDEKTKSSSNVSAGQPHNPNSMRLSFCYKDFDVAVDASRLSTCNIWREKRYPSEFLISDRLHQELIDRDFRFFKRQRALEVTR